MAEDLEYRRTRTKRIQIRTNHAASQFELWWEKVQKEHEKATNKMDGIEISGRLWSKMMQSARRWRKGGGGEEIEIRMDQINGNDYYEI